jgi:hypothetical protein
MKTSDRSLFIMPKGKHFDVILALVTGNRVSYGRK